MVTDNNDILLDDDGDDQIKNGDWEMGDGTMDDCFLIFKLNSNACKFDPIIGPNLVLMTNKNINSGEIKQVLGLHLERDNKRYKKLVVKNGIIDFEI